MTAVVKFKKVRIPVHFGGVSIGDETCSVAIKVNHEELGEDDKAAVMRGYELLCSRRLKGILTLGRRGDGETQGKLMPTDVEVNGTCDTNSLSVTTKCVGSRLTFALSEINASELAQFAKRDGYFTITSLMEQIDDESDKEDEDADDEE